MDENDKLFKSSEAGLTFIEQLQKLASIQCKKENRPYLVGVNENAKVALLTQPNCKQWNCEACAARNARHWLAKIINGVNRLGGEWSFLTLTAHRKMRGVKSVQNLRDGWKKFYNRILAANEKSANDIYYVKVWEQHTDGTFHLHVLVNKCYGTRWAKDNAAAVGLGFQADWQEIDNAGKIAGYVAKYTLKNATVSRGGVTWPKGLRRIETSRNWPKLPEFSISDEVAWIIKLSRDEQLLSAGRYHVRGFQILDQVKGEKPE